MMLPLLDPVENSAPGPFADDVANDASRDVLVLSELWISFASLLRSHLGALQTSGKLAAAVFSHPDDASVEIQDLSRTLNVSLQVASGEGEWSVTRLGVMIAAGNWVLRTDATVSIDAGASQDMEFAVEEFASKLWARTVTPAAPEGLPESLVGAEETEA